MFLFFSFFSDRLLTVGGVLGVIALLVDDIWDDFERFKPAGGMLMLIALSVIFSKAPRKVTLYMKISLNVIYFYVSTPVRVDTNIVVL